MKTEAALLGLGALGLAAWYLTRKRGDEAASDTTVVVAPGAPQTPQATPQAPILAFLGAQGPAGAGSLGGSPGRQETPEAEWVAVPSLEDSRREAKRARKGAEKAALITGAASAAPAAGAAIGSIIGPIGTAIGGLFGSLAGGLASVLGGGKGKKRISAGPSDVPVYTPARRYALAPSEAALNNNPNPSRFSPPADEIPAPYGGYAVQRFTRGSYLQTGYGTVLK